MTSQPFIRVVGSSESLRAIPYDDTRPAQPPNTVNLANVANIATPPRSSKFKGITGLRKSKLSPDSRDSANNAPSEHYNDDRRDSGLAPSNSTARNSRTTLNTEVDSNRSLRHSPSSSQFPTAVRRERPDSATAKAWDSSPQEQSDFPVVPQLPFIGLMTEIPTGSFDDLSQPGQVEFTNRGSMLLGGKKVDPANGSRDSVLSGRKPSVYLSPTQPIMPKSALSADDQMLSSQVRSMYEEGSDRASYTAVTSRSVSVVHDDNASSTDVSRIPCRTHDVCDWPAEAKVELNGEPEAPLCTNRRISLLLREEQELAGGIEDWENVSNGDVDRYGFIIPPRPTPSSSPKSGRPQSPDPPRLQRVSTALQLASEAPRRRRSRRGRDPPSAQSPARSTSAFSNKRPDSRNNRPPSSQTSLRGTLGGTQSKLRSTTDKLPHRRKYRCLNEAGDMLTLPPGLADIKEDQEDSKAAEDLRRREREREDKWRKMARVVNAEDKSGGGMVFEFDTKSPKVIERTWKGIPDRWRATAWHAFLSASARRHAGLSSDDDIKTAFHKLLGQGSPDDVQIDLDVPRTINSHIMFRRRYRGGQRLLFRVLHCLSIYFPQTGYVQGMAALAATLLCYFDEEMAFVMLVRLWQLRGLERLYQSGFEGLMQALGEFETGWLANGEVSRKLKVLDIDPTAYGTRWYLTLFNYSIPFPAQLRVWDVFMLLGDADTTLTSTPRNTVPMTRGDVPNEAHTTASDASYHGSLDVLHAVSAALIDGTREILLDSDFENAMKVLTSWIPIRDEELLMRVAKAEWKMHRRRK
ncbi:MAG: hypothetical protein Q9182_005568 [Xanthomendoza sp. 2 TL-2023]